MWEKLLSLSDMNDKIQAFSLVLVLFFLSSENTSRFMLMFVQDSNTVDQFLVQMLMNEYSFSKSIYHFVRGLLKVKKLHEQIPMEEIKAYS